MHPLRLQYEMFADANPVHEIGWAMLREQVRENRGRRRKTIRFCRCRRSVSEQIVDALDAWRDMAEQASERMFLSIYGSPALQAAVGIDPKATEPMRKAGKSPLHHQSRARADCRTEVANPGRRNSGGHRPRTAVHRDDEGSVDERGFEAIRRIREAQKEQSPIT